MVLEAALPGVSPRRLRALAFAVGALALLIVCAGLGVRTMQARRLQALTQVQALPVVSVTTPARAQGSSVLELPGRLQAYSQAPIYARVSGYLKDWKVDIGTPVRAGQLLAEIEAPDLQQQIAQARADLLTAEANAALARSTATRWHQLLETDSVSRQDVDVRDGDFAAKQAISQAARANLERLQVLSGFTRIVAPFSGIVTARNTDIGALINVGSSAGQELFIVSDTHQLRLYVSVPERYSARVERGTQARISVPARPGRSFPAVVSDTSGAVDPASGATLVQLTVRNDSAELVPGSFAVVHFDLPLDPSNFRIPASAVIFDSKGVRVATLSADNRVSFKPIVISRDLGDVVGVSHGLEAADRIIDSPPDGIAAGARVRIGPAGRER